MKKTHYAEKDINFIILITIYWMNKKYSFLQTKI